jgi:hypothetical protein
MCSWGKKESDYVGMPTYVMWKKGVTAGKKGEWHKTQLKKFLSFVPDATGANLVCWYRRQKENPKTNIKPRDASKELRKLKLNPDGVIYKKQKSKRKYEVLEGGEETPRKNALISIVELGNFIFLI